MNIFLLITYVVGGKRNRLNETVLLSIHNICYSSEIRFFLIKHSYLGVCCFTTMHT